MSLSPPETLRVSYADWDWETAWEWPEIATTWRLRHRSEPNRVRYLKVVRCGHHPTALDESARMQWASLFLPVPIVLGTGSDDGVDWLLTDGLAGTDATRHALLADPARVVPALARGL